MYSCRRRETFDHLHCDRISKKMYDEFKHSMLLHFVLLEGGMRLSGKCCNVTPHYLRLEMNSKPASRIHPLGLSACRDHCQMLEQEVM